MIRPALIDMNPVELKYYRFTVSLDKCSGSCNVSSPKICVPEKTEDINVKEFNMITNTNESKAMAKHIISFDCKCKFNSTTCNSTQKWKMKRVNVNVKINVCKKIIVGILAHMLVRIANI